MTCCYFVLKNVLCVVLFFHVSIGCTHFYSKCGEDVIYCKKLLGCSEDVQIRENTGEKCNNLFPSASAGNEKLCDIEFKFYNHQCSCSSLNITFKDIQWQKAAFKYTTLIDNTESPYSLNTTICKEFVVTNTSAIIGKTLYFDCPMTQREQELTTTLFEFEAWQGQKRMTKRYSFKIPGREKLNPINPKDPDTLFMYIDITDGDDKTLIVEEPKFLNISSYNVTLYKNNTDQPHEVFSNEIIVQSKYNTNKYLKKQYGVKTFPVGYYFFVVEAIDNQNRSMCTTKSHLFIINPEKSITEWILVGITLILILAVCLIILKKWRRDMKLLTEGNKILFVYDPNSSKYNSIFPFLAEELSKNWQMNISLDVFDIPKTDHKNPCKWLKQEYQKAIKVIFFNSPDLKNFRSNHPYRDLYSCAMTSRDTPLQSNSIKKTIIGVYFAFTSTKFDEDIRASRYYELPKDLNTFIFDLSGDQKYLYWKKQLIKKDPKFIDLENKLKILIQETKEELKALAKEDNVPLIRKEYEYDTVHMMPRRNSDDGELVDYFINSSDE